jgi:ribosomal protein S18 acetylase RimI-like enzyme
MNGAIDITEQPRQWRLAEECLARAFIDDPVMCFLFPGPPATRLRRIRSLYRLIVPSYARHGRILLHESGLAAAVWQRPEPPAPPRWQTLTNSLQALWTLRGAANRGFAVQQTMLEARPAQPYWYLAILGSQPEGRGSGAAKALVGAGLEACDASDLPAFLESSSPDNIGYYQQFGFVVTEALQVPDGPPLWAMLRQK